MQSVYASSNLYDIRWISKFRTEHPEIAESELAQNILTSFGAEFLQDNLDTMVISSYNLEPVIFENVIVWLELLKLLKDTNPEVAIWRLLSKLDDIYSYCQLIDTETAKISINNCMLLYEHLFLETEFKEIIHSILENNLSLLTDQTVKSDVGFYNHHLLINLDTNYEKHNYRIIITENLCADDNHGYPAITNKAHLIDLMALKNRLDNRHLKTKRAE